MEAIKVYTFDNDPTPSVLIKITQTEIKELKHILKCKYNEPPDIFSLCARNTIFKLSENILNAIQGGQQDER